MTIEELHEALEAGIKDLESDYGQEATDDMIYDLAKSISVRADNPRTAQKFLDSL